MEVVSPGTIGNVLMKGISVEQHKQIIDFSLIEQSKS